MFKFMEQAFIIICDIQPVAGKIHLRTCALVPDYVDSTKKRLKPFPNLDIITQLPTLPNSLKFIKDAWITMDVMDKQVPINRAIITDFNRQYLMMFIDEINKGYDIYYVSE
jgi:hypothetical protein